MANKFWVGGTGSWSDTTHWATTSGGAGSTGVPASGDVVTFDANSGGGTVTVDQNISLGSGTITGGAFTGTIDFTVGGPWTVTCNSFSFSGTGARKILCGSTTFNLNATTGNLWDLTTTTNLDALSDFSSATFVIGASNSSTTSQAFVGGVKTYGTVTLTGGKTGGGPVYLTNLTATNCNISGPMQMGASGLTITNAFNWVGTAAAPISVVSQSGASTSTMTCTNGGTITWGVLNRIVNSGTTVTVNNGLDLKGNTGFTFNAPSTGAIGVIGS